MIDRAKSALPVAAPVSEAELKKVAERLTDTRPTTRIGLLLLALVFGAFVVWAFVAPLDEGVPAPGTITVESKRKIVQHLTGGIIKAVLVKEAQEVQAGDPLIQLDDTMSKASFDAAREQYYALQAQADRLRAEALHMDKIAFSPALLEAAGDPVAAQNMSGQQQLFATRRAALQGELAILEASARSAAEQTNGIEAQIKGKKAQLKFVLEQLEGSRELAKEGYLPRNRWFDDERLAADLQASVTELQSTAARAASMAAEARARLAQRPREFQKEVETQFADTRREAMVAGERLRAAREDFARTVIRAPVDGYVSGLSPFSVGSVITSSVRLMDIVPKDEALILEVKIDPSVIDRVHAGLPVDINLHVFANDPSLVLEGVLESVSADLVTDSNPNIPPHYLGRVRVTPEGLKKLGNRVLQPGMPAQIVIKTGERTLVQYLLKPLVMRVSSSMKEH
jgi:protease secretion system membrane fusion protein